MDAKNITRFATKAEQAVAAAEGIREDIHQTNFNDASDLAQYANRMAEAEGAAHAWARVRMTVNYHSQEGRELTDLVFLDAIMDLLAEGADDNWSGRGNDVRRARFDGIRKACKEMRYLVTTV